MSPVHSNRFMPNFMFTPRGLDDQSLAHHVPAQSSSLLRRRTAIPHRRAAARRTTAATAAGRRAASPGQAAYTVCHRRHSPTRTAREQKSETNPASRSVGRGAMRLTAASTTRGSTSLDRRVVLLDTFRGRLEQRRIKQDLNENVTQEPRPRSLVNRTLPPQPVGELERQFHERARLVKPAIIFVMLDDAACDGREPGILIVNNSSAACLPCARTRRSATESQSGTAVPARKYGSSRNGHPWAR